MRQLNYFFKTIFIFIISCQFLWAGVLGDINNDSIVGLPEAIYALGISSGIKTENSNQKYNFNDYYFFDGSEFFYKVSVYNESTGKNDTNIEYAYHLAKSINNQITNIECWYGTYSYQEYYSLEKNSQIQSIGDYWNLWYDGNILLGSNQMVKGEVYNSLYNINDLPYWCEYEFLGVEDVETEAGTFKDCIKISKINSANWGLMFSYYAKNVGLVKQVYCSDINNSYKLELIGLSNGELSFPSNLTIKRYYGNYSSSILNGYFSLFFLPNQGYKSTLIFQNFPYDYQHKIISLESTDGINFTPTNANENENVSVSINGNNVSGTYVYTYWDEESQSNKSISTSFTSAIESK